MTAMSLRAAPAYQALARYWRQWRSRARARAELAALGAEKGGLARDLDLSAGDLRRLAEMPSTSAALLHRRMSLLNLSPAAVSANEPAVMRDLQRTCSFCPLKSQCRHDLASERRTHEIAEYCPNEQTLQALRGNFDTGQGAASRGDP